MPTLLNVHTLPPGQTLPPPPCYPSLSPPAVPSSLSLSLPLLLSLCFTVPFTLRVLCWAPLYVSVVPTSLYLSLSLTAPTFLSHLLSLHLSHNFHIYTFPLSSVTLPFSVSLMFPLTRIVLSWTLGLSHMHSPCLAHAFCLCHGRAAWSLLLLHTFCLP